MKKKIILVSSILFIIDLISKILIDCNMNLNDSFIIINNFLSITKVYNDGASWSILSGYNIILILIAIVILIFLYVYQKRFKENSRNLIAFSLLYSGIIGNMFNRIIYGYVIDFIDFKIFGYDYPVFNFADIFIVLGVLSLVIAIIKKEDEYESSSR